MVATAPIKVDAETDRLIANAAHFLRLSKKDVVDAAVREFIATHQGAIQQGALDALQLLDGTTRAATRLLADATDREIDSLGGFSSER